MTESNLLAAAAAATCGQVSDCQNNAHSVTNILKVVKKNISLHKSFLRSKRQVLSCYNSSRDSSATRSKDKEKQETTYDATTKNDESVDKDAEIMRLIEERRKLPKEEKHRLKELSKEKKNASDSMEDYTQCLTRNKQKIRLDSEKPTRQRTTLQHTN